MRWKFARAVVFLLAPIGAAFNVAEMAVAQEVKGHEHHAGREMQRRAAEHWTAPEEAAKRPNPVPADHASIERGGKLFRSHCAACHGFTGRGDGPAAAGLAPPPSDLAVMGKQHPPGDLAWKIENGRGPMPAWKGALSGSQIWDLVNFLQSLGGAAKRPGSGHRHDTPDHRH